MKISDAAAQPALPKHRRLVFTDPVALRYLEEDPSTLVLERRSTLRGYEIYVVEQWACSRIHPTFIITTYTGDPSHTVVVGVLSVPTDDSTWSPRLKLYFKAVTQYHARNAETPLGSLMVTDLSTFPSSLTVIPVPDGDVKKHREDFIVNEDLKRLGCAGRAGLKLQYPPTATEAKFYQLYRTSERIPLYTAVTELVKMCQMALMMFDKLAPEYVDGLLCDVTEAAISDWWTDIGLDLFNVEPNDGVLGPTTVAALLGTLMGARNRLHSFGAPVSKDAFDLPYLKRGIGSFQKSMKLERTRRLDRRTLEKLHRVTAKAVSSEGWAGAVRTTVAELSGKGGEMVMGMVGGREKKIADIETLGMDHFVDLISGRRAKWLWRGKPRKHHTDDGVANGSGTSDMMFTRDDQGGYIWTSRKRRSFEDTGATERRSFQGSERSWKQQPDALDEVVRKGAPAKLSDTRTGFDRFKDAVGFQGRRSHTHNKAKENYADQTADAAYNPSLDSDAEPDDLAEDEPGDGVQAQAPDNDYNRSNNVNNDDNDVDEAADSPKRAMRNPPEINVESVSVKDDQESQPRKPSAQSTQSSQPPTDDDDYAVFSRTTSAEAPDDRKEIPESAVISLRRPQSCIELNQPYRWKQRDNYWPRHLSFSTVEEVMLGWEGFEGQEQQVKERPGASLDEAIDQEEILASDAQIAGSDILELSLNTVPWVERQVESVEDLNQHLYDRRQDLNSLYLQKFREYENLRDISSDEFANEQTYLQEHAKKVELLDAKLDYDVNTLESKIEDFETGLDEFEQHVDAIESRVRALFEGDGEKKSSSSWFPWFRKGVTS